MTSKGVGVIHQHLPDSYKRQQFLAWLEKYGNLKRLPRQDEFVSGPTAQVTYSVPE